MNNHNEWQPTAEIKYLKQRAEIFKKIRNFFMDRNVLEVETPLLCNAGITDPYIETIRCQYPTPAGISTRYLQTSPEYAMKRLLAAGSGDIFQICKAFRQDEQGRIHNPEFTMLEWYRLGFDHIQLMNEMDELLQLILNCEKAERFTYQGLFEAYLHCNPHQASAEELQILAAKHQIYDIPGIDVTDKDTWLQLLLTHVIEPQLALTKPAFIYDFPTSQAALARIRSGNPSVAERFEVYYKSIELANGFHELTNADEQAKRFENDLHKRQLLGYFQPKKDLRFLQALQHGLPVCAGVALGLDRLIMLALDCNSIADVISFNFAIA